MAILILENSYNDLKKSRIPLGNFFMSKGYKVHYACPSPELKYINNIPMSRNSLAPYKLLKGFLILIDLEVNLSIKKTLSYRFIPNVLNYLASFRNRKIKRVAVITGLGYAFIQTNNSYKSRIQRLLIKLFYKIASKRIQIVSHNPDDLIDLGVKNGKIILGSGIASFRKTIAKELHTDSIRLLFVSRLMKSKGILTTIDLFEKLKIQKPQATLTIAGKIDPENPDSLSVEEFNKLKNIKGLHYLGYVNDIDSIYADCNVLLFPSIYREGVPRAILESLKHGLTIVTKDMPGCKETIKNNGFLISEKNINFDVVEYLASLNKHRLLENSKRSMELFNEIFSDSVIYPQYLTLLTTN